MEAWKTCFKGTTVLEQIGSVYEYKVNGLSGFLKRVGTLIKRFDSLCHKSFRQHLHWNLLNNLLNRFCCVQQWRGLSTQGALKLNFYEDSTSILKNHFLFLKLIVSAERIPILHCDLHCNNRDRMSSLIYNRRPLTFLSYLYGVVKPILNRTEGNKSSSFVSEIRKMSTFLSSICF